MFCIRGLADPEHGSYSAPVFHLDLKETWCAEAEKYILSCTSVELAALGMSSAFAVFQTDESYIV